jgi:cytochrome c-type biogenesis protein CcmH/NrfF
VIKRLMKVVMVVGIAVTMMGAGTSSSRFDKMGHKFMCTCGCAQVLLECNHVGCPDSPGLIAALHTQMDAGASDEAIYKSFADTYGPTVLAAPLRGGFDNVAWIVPFALLVLGIGGVVLLLRVWQRRYEKLGPAVVETGTPEDDAMRERIRNETKYGE